MSGKGSKRARSVGSKGSSSSTITNSSRGSSTSTDSNSSRGSSKGKGKRIALTGGHAGSVRSKKTTKGSGKSTNGAGRGRPKSKLVNQDDTGEGKYTLPSPPKGTGSWIFKRETFEDFTNINDPYRHNPYMNGQISIGAYTSTSRNSSGSRKSSSGSRKSSKTSKTSAKSKKK